LDDFVDVEDGLTMVLPVSGAAPHDQDVAARRPVALRPGGRGAGSADPAQLYLGTAARFLPNPPNLADAPSVGLGLPPQMVELRPARFVTPLVPRFEPLE
jgi:hypothetical protein